METTNIIIDNVKDFKHPAKRYGEFNATIEKLRELLQDNTILKDVFIKDNNISMLELSAFNAVINSFDIAKAGTDAISKMPGNSDYDLKYQASILQNSKNIFNDIKLDIEEFIEWEQARIDGCYNIRIPNGCSYMTKIVHITPKVSKKSANMNNSETVLDFITKKIGNLIAQKLKEDDNLLNDVLKDTKNKMSEIDGLIADMEKDDSELAEKVRQWKLEQIGKNIDKDKDKILKNIFKVKTVTKEIPTYLSSSGSCGYASSGGCGVSSRRSSGGCGWDNDYNYGRC